MQQASTLAAIMCFVSGFKKNIANYANSVNTDCLTEDTKKNFVMQQASTLAAIMNAFCSENP
ncbi:MAG TPA: hypothetical protein PLK75_04775 [Bacteroidales bacterium]|nr:hypothetical protein [Bacteroidales bacterium]